MKGVYVCICIRINSNVMRARADFIQSAFYGKYTSMDKYPLSVNSLLPDRAAA